MAMIRLCCPSCGCTYELPPELVRPAEGAPARRLRCRRCATVFTPDTAGPAVPPGAGAPIPPRRPVLATALAVVAGLGSGAVAGAGAALLLRPDVVATLAADARLPAALRHRLAAIPAVPLPAVRLNPLPDPASALRFDVESRLGSLPDGARVLEVAGAIVNPTARPSAIPALELRLVDAAGRTLERRPVRAAATAVPGGGEVAFSTVAVDLPPGATAARLVAAAAVLDPR